MAISGNEGALHVFRPPHRCTDVEELSTQPWKSQQPSLLTQTSLSQRKGVAKHNEYLQNVGDKSERLGRNADSY